MDADTAIAGASAPESEQPVAPASVIAPGHGDHVAAAVDTTPFETPFDFLFEDLADDFPAKHLPNTDPATVVAKLRALGAAMVEAGPPTTPNSNTPAVYTYWGQFVDHDLTANTDRDGSVSNITSLNPQPLPPEEVREGLKNLRQPALNLDSLYGPGSVRDGDIKMAVGTVAEQNNNGSIPPGAHVPPLGDAKRDLPRQNMQAQLGDARNDENLIIAQLHTAFLRFHNVAADWVEARHPDWRRKSIWVRAKRLTQWHYQWLTVNDFLREITTPGVVDSVMLGDREHSLRRDGKVFMPLEFSIAAYRFGHSMVRGAYDFNRNFGTDPGAITRASFDLLFAFTGGGKFNAPQPDDGSHPDVLPFNWVIEWDRFVDHASDNPIHFARKIDTLLAGPLHDMRNQGNEQPPGPVQQLLKNLAMRNLVRGYVLAMPTGQAVAEALEVEPLTHAELTSGDPGIAQALTDGAFLDATPLWFYVLKEAEVRANGNSLGEVGSRIVAETLIGQLLADPDSYLQRGSGWTPMFGAVLPDGEPIVTIADLFRFAGLAA